MDHSSLSSSITLQRTRIVLASQVQYDIEQCVEEGAARPRVLGAGRFAKVFAAQQLIAGQPARQVAIKALHDHADYQDERLFSQEVALNREFAARPAPGISPVLDVIHLSPLVMCGCGSLYHPMCPRGCGAALQRGDLKGRPFPALRCSACDYELSAEFVPERGAELCSRRAKPCCSRESDPHANTGTILNFALREVMIMESLERSLADHAAFVDDPTAGAERVTRGERALDLLGLLPARRRRQLLELKVGLLGKVNLMVQIGEAAAWLHSECQVVHKDLAPDNIMIRCAPSGRHVVSCDDGDEGVTALLDQAANRSVQICVIDFGLSDKEKLTRSWYEDADMSLAATKLPYLSPEARYRRQSIGASLEVDSVQRRFRIPAALAQSPASIRAGDIIADRHDRVHAHDLRVASVEDGFAQFDGAAPRSLPRHLEIIRPLGEAHDVYALGAILYYILTGRHDQVEHLSNLVGAIQDQPCRLDVPTLRRRDNYANRRNSIREPFARDALMLVILRAMVRGRAESFIHDRTDRGPGPTCRFLTELKLIQQSLNAEVFGELHQARRVRLRRVATLLGLACLLWFLVSGAAFLAGTAA